MGSEMCIRDRAIDDIKNVLVKLSHKNIGILITDHNVRETLEICDKAAIIHDGEVIAEGAVNLSLIHI